MKAVAYRQTGPIDRSDALLDVELPLPQPGPHDLRVKVAAVSVNPVDSKIRLARQPAEGELAVLGWDAVGVVDAVGAAVQGFQPGDRVFYAGAIDRPGSNAEYHLVDARIASHAPQTLSDAAAAAMPLTSITAWELLFDRLGVPEGGGAGQHLLILGGAGGVGSILIQLARQLTQLTVIATAGRADSQDWCHAMGAHHVLDHRQPLPPQLAALGIAGVELQAALSHSDQHWQELVTMAAPQGRIALIDDPASPLDLMALKFKSLSLHWELMFTRSLYQTADMAEQGKLLHRVATLLDAGRLKSTLTREGGRINAENLRSAHAAIEAGQACGKLVLVGF